MSPTRTTLENNKYFEALIIKPCKNLLPNSQKPWCKVLKPKCFACRRHQIVEQIILMVPYDLRNHAAHTNHKNHTTIKFIQLLQLIQPILYIKHKIHTLYQVHPAHILQLVLFASNLYIPYNPYNSHCSTLFKSISHNQSNQNTRLLARACIVPEEGVL